MSSLRIAVEGCGHGTLHAIYASVERSCQEKGWPDIDLLIICGDFQAVRNAYDLNCVAMPAKYREMCDFHEYYSGHRKAPYLTIFVGGNHEASNYLFELYYGGWVAENIYYMGAANVLQFGPIRIAGMSGIWKGYNYNKPHHERLPYNEDDLKSIYHVRNIDTRRLLQFRDEVDIGISHDWPRGVEWMGNWQALFKRKEHLEPDARNGQLGNVAAKSVLDALRPGWWFSGHLHCKYAAVVDHINQDKGIPFPNGNSQDVGVKSGAAHGLTNGNTQLSKPCNTDEIDLELDDEPIETGGLPIIHNKDAIDLDSDDEKPVAAMLAGEQVFKDQNQQQTPGREDQKIHENGASKSIGITRFLALDKCLPGRHFLQLLEIPAQTQSPLARPVQLRYDREWLAITRAFALAEPLLLGDSKFNAPKAKTDEQYQRLIAEQHAWVQKLADADLEVPSNFTRTAPIYDGGNIRDPKYTQIAGGLKEYTNPQTAQFCELLQIPNPFDLPEEEREERMRVGPRPSQGGFGGKDGAGRGGGRGGRGRRGGHSYHGSMRGGWRGGRH